MKKKATAAQVQAFEGTKRDEAHHKRGIKEGSRKDKKLDNVGALAMAKKRGKG